MLELLERVPLHADSIYLLGVIALDAGRNGQALLRIHHATLLAPGEPRFHHGLGETYRVMGKLQEAVECFLAALRLEPNLAAAHQALGLALLDQGQLSGVVSSLRQILALQPQQPRALTNLGQALHRQGNLEEAANCFREAIRLKADYAIAHNNFGAILHEQGHYPEAIPLFQRALALEPKYPEAHCNLANSFPAQGDAAAIPSYQEAIRLRPNYLNARLNLGIALAAHGRHEEAAAALQTAVHLKSDHAETFEQLGHVLLQQARWEAALPFFEKVSSLDPHIHGREIARANRRVRAIGCPKSSKNGWHGSHGLPAIFCLAFAWHLPGKCQPTYAFGANPKKKPAHSCGLFEIWLKTGATLRVGEWTTGSGWDAACCGNASGSPVPGRRRRFHAERRRC